jgi:hypothetical protein
VKPDGMNSLMGLLPAWAATSMGSGAREIGLCGPVI